MAQSLAPPNLLRSTAADVWHFMRSNVLHFLLLIPGVFLVTWFHEAAHAVAVITQGGQVTEFAWLPSPGEWGHVQYLIPAGQEHSVFLVFVAPYILWSAMCFMTAILALRRAPYPSWLASALLFWGFLLPFGDIVYAFIPYLLGATTDFRAAFGPPTWQIAVAGMIAMAAVGTAGYPVQRRLLRDRAVGIPGYIVLGCLAGGLLLLLT